MRNPFRRRDPDPDPYLDDDYTDTLGTMIQFPHCDTLILHRPGSCTCCDGHPDWQAFRSAQGVAFSDDTAEFVKAHSLLPCPSEFRRPAEVRDRWPGNTPKEN